MKVISLFVMFLTVMLISCRKDKIQPILTLSSENDYAVSLLCISNIDSDAINYFKGDADYLAYNDISNNSCHVGYHHTELDFETVTFYLSKLSVIYQAVLNDTGALHAMIFQFNVHQQLADPILNSFGIKFIDSSVLRNELINTPNNTSNYFLNELHTQYVFNQAYEVERTNFVRMKST